MCVGTSVSEQFPKDVLAKLFVITLVKGSLATIHYEHIICVT